MKNFNHSGLPVMMAVILMCGLLAACGPAPVGGQIESAPPTENTAPMESADSVENMEELVNSISAADLALSEEGRLTSGSANAVNLQAALDDYFAARTDAVNEPNMAAPSSISGGNAVSSDAIARANALREFLEDRGLYIVSVETSYEIREIAPGELPATVDMMVYEWTQVNYNNIGTDAPAGAQFGYGNNHDMTASLNGDGTVSIVKDSYDERDISGHASADYDGGPTCTAPVESAGLENTPQEGRQGDG